MPASAPVFGEFRLDALLQTGLLLVQSHLVPIATLATPVSPGALAVTVTSSTDAAAFAEMGHLSWWDGSNEYPCLVASVSGATITLDPVTPLTLAHSAGAVIATNLVLVEPSPRDQSAAKVMLANGFPVIHVAAEQSVESPAALSGVMQSMQSDGLVCITYLLSAVQPGPASGKLDRDLLKTRLVLRSEADLATMKTAFKSNSNRLNGSAVEMVSKIAHVAAEDEGPDLVYVQRLDVYLRSDIR